MAPSMVVKASHVRLFGVVVSLCLFAFRDNEHLFRQRARTTTHLYLFERPLQVQLETTASLFVLWPPPTVQMIES